MPTWQKLALVALAGGLGTLARVTLSGFVQRVTSGGFVWGTVVVNVVGCFLFGLVWSLTEPLVRVSADVRLIVLGGFMGAFTTFSTYVFDLGTLAQDSRFGALIGNLALQNLVGFAFLFAGLGLGRALS